MGGSGSTLSAILRKRVEEGGKRLEHSSGRERSQGKLKREGKEMGGQSIKGPRTA